MFRIYDIHCRLILEVTCAQFARDEDKLRHAEEIGREFLGADFLCVEFGGEL